jgi:transcriptional regulator with XRE-family HTH domain
MTSRSAKEADVAVGRWIRLFRQNAKISQRGLGTRIGVSYRQVQEYESGDERVGVSRLMQIAVALDVPVMEFFGRSVPRA